VNSGIFQLLFCTKLTVTGELSEDAKMFIAIAAGVPFTSESVIDRAKGIVTIKYTTTAKCDVRIVDGRILVFQEPPTS
jgi:hypothetical protein